MKQTYRKDAKSLIVFIKEFLCVSAVKIVFTGMNAKYDSSHLSVKGGVGFETIP